MPLMEVSSPTEFPGYYLKELYKIIINDLLFQKFFYRIFIGKMTCSLRKVNCF